MNLRLFVLSCFWLMLVSSQVPPPPPGPSSSPIGPVGPVQLDGSAGSEIEASGKRDDGFATGVPIYRDFGYSSAGNYDDFGHDFFDGSRSDFAVDYRREYGSAYDDGDYRNSFDDFDKDRKFDDKDRKREDMRPLRSGLVFKTEIDELRNRFFELDRAISAFTQSRTSANSIANFFTSRGRLTVSAALAGTKTPVTFVGRKAIENFFQKRKDHFPPGQVTASDLIIREDLLSGIRDDRDDYHKDNFFDPQAAHVRAILFIHSVDDGRVYAILDVDDLWIKAETFKREDKKDKKDGPSPPGGLFDDKKRKEEFAPVRWFLARRDLRCIFFDPKNTGMNQCHKPDAYSYSDGYSGRGNDYRGGSGSGSYSGSYGSYGSYGNGGYGNDYGNGGYGNGNSGNSGNVAGNTDARRNAGVYSSGLDIGS